MAGLRSPVSPSLHICFVSQEYPPDTGWGGIGSYTYDMAHALVAAGHRVTVIARSDAAEKTSDDSGVQVHRIQPAPRWDRMRVVWRLNKVWPGFAWAAMRRLRSIHRADPVDIVEAGECRADGFFISWMREPRPRLVTRLHLAWIFVDRQNSIQPDWRKRLCYWMEKQSILRADAVTAPSAAVVELTRTWLGAGLAAQVVPNPIDIGGFAPNESVREREVLFVGRLERRKGLGIFCRVAPLVLGRCPDVRVRVLGSDGVDENGHSWRARLLDSIRQEDRGRISFEHVSRRELVNSYRRASLCIVPSLWENFPYVALEAMACGTPVIAARSGGLPELVGDGRSGFLVGPEDAEGFAAAICDLMDDPEKSRRMGLEARRRAESVFASATVARRMLDVYRVLCEC